MLMEAAEYLGCPERHQGDENSAPDQGPPPPGTTKKNDAGSKQIELHFDRYTPEVAKRKRRIGVISQKKYGVGSLL